MRAIIASEPGPAGIVLVEAPDPMPAHDEVLVAVHTVAINQLDLNVISGVGPGAQARLPRILGIDPAGVVVAQGSSVAEHLVGSRVVAKPNIPCGVCARCARGDEGDCPRQTILGVHRDGGAASLVAVPARVVVPIGDADFATATAAIHSVPIALHAIAAGGGIESGSTVLVTGAAGAVGAAAVQLALRAGARVLAAVRRRDAELPEGAIRVLHAGAADLVDSVRSVASEGADLILDATGDAAVTEACLGLLAWGGSLVICSTGIPSVIAMDLRPFYLGRRRLMGTASADLAQAHEGIRLVRDEGVQVPIRQRIPLSEAVAGYRDFAQRRQGGKVVIDVVD